MVVRAAASADPSVERELLAEYTLRLADDRLVLGHRLSEWCGHAPILEEELALANIALDLIGQAAALLELAAEAEGRGRTPDDLAYFRDAIDYRNVLLVEQPNGDFAATMARQFLFDAWDVGLTERLAASAHPRLAAWAAKASLESRYHLRHSREWVLRLGDGTSESHRRIEAAFEDLWRFVPELFDADEVEQRLAAAGVAPHPAELRAPWGAIVEATLAEAGLAPRGDPPFPRRGGRRGLHGEDLGHMLAEMQSVARAFPGARW